MTDIQVDLTGTPTPTPNERIVISGQNAPIEKTQHDATLHGGQGHRQEHILDEDEKIPEVDHDEYVNKGIGKKEMSNSRIQHKMPIQRMESTPVDEKIETHRQLDQVFNPDRAEGGDESNIDREKSLFKKVPISDDMIDHHQYRIKERAVFEFVDYIRSTLLMMSDYKKEQLSKQVPWIMNYLESKLKERIEVLKQATKLVIRKPNSAEDLRFLYKICDPGSEHYIDNWSLVIMEAMLGLQLDQEIQNDHNSEDDERRYYQRGFISSGLLWLDGKTKPDRTTFKNKPISIPTT